MARAYQEAHMLQSLQSDFKNLTTVVKALHKFQSQHEEKIFTLAKQNTDLAAQVSALEIREKANEHNATARLRNLHAYLSTSTPLTPSAPSPSSPSKLPSSPSKIPPPSSSSAPKRTLQNPNPTARNIALTPLHSLRTNKAIPNFPKRMNDIKTMAPADVIQVLQALGVTILGMGGVGGAGERKMRLRGEVGIPRDSA